MLHHCTTLQIIIIIFDMVVRQKGTLNTKNNKFNSVSVMTEKLHNFVYVRHILPLSTIMIIYHMIITHKWYTVCDWLNPHSLGTISAIGCIENLD